MLLHGFPDITGWCDVSVSSRHALAGALTDGSTESFWESGEEERGRTKWIQITCPLGVAPSTVHIHIDNTRDIVVVISDRYMKHILLNYLPDYGIHVNVFFRRAKPWLYHSPTDTARRSSCTYVIAS